MFDKNQTRFTPALAPTALTAVLLAAVLVLQILGGVPAAAQGSAVPPPATGVAEGRSSAAVSGAAPSLASSNEVSASALASAALAWSTQDGIPSRYVYVPRSGPAPPPVAQTGGHVEPSYAQAPAPLGVADFGLSNESGVVQPTILRSTSLEGTFRTNSTGGLQPEYMDNGAPDAYGIQLNAVLTNVTLDGSNQTGGIENQFWTQNVVQYASQLHELQFLDNVWSFWPGFTSTTFLRYGPNGTFVDPEFYYALGPTITIAYPFSLTLYLNSTVIDGNNAVFFNYTLSNATRTTSGSYDYVVFRSGGTATFGSAEYEADGYNYDPVGLPNDFEFVIGGPGGGSTTDLLAADASMALDYWNASTRSYQAIPAAYDTGGETGETASGADVWYAGSTAYLSTGPSLVSGLWNATGRPGGDPGVGVLHVRLEPSNAFLFLGPEADGGNLTAPSPAWQWAPLVGASEASAGWLSGALALPPGAYTAVVLESDFDPVIRTVVVGAAASWLNVTLVPDPAAGLYTPLFAWSNAQLAAISSAGAGTAAAPYRLDAAPFPGQRLSPLFGGFNDYGYPTFAGLELLGTSASVAATPATFWAPAPPWLNASATLLDVPNVLGLATWVVDAQNVAIVNATFTGIWFAYRLGGVDASDLMVFQSKNVLVANDTFEISGGTGLFVYDRAGYGASTVTIWGNTFRSNDTVVFFPSCPGYCGGLELPDVGLQLMADGALVYNNAFWLLDGNAAWTPTSDWWSLIEAPPVTYADRWNVTPEPASDAAYAAGFPWFPLVGNILGMRQQGGNFWENYGSAADPFGDLPFNNDGNITVGGDYAPIVPFALYRVSVSVAAPSNDTWVVEVGSQSDYGWNFQGTAGGSGASVLPNGTYTANGYLVIPGRPVTNPGAQLAASATFVVNGSAVNVSLPFEPDYLVVFQPYGYDVNGTPWGLCIDTTPWGGPSPWTYSGGTLWAALPNGTFNYTSYVIDFSSWGLSGPGCASVPLLNVTVAAPVGTITVSGSDKVIPVEFNETFPVSFYATGVPSTDDEWQVNDTPYPAQSGWGSGPLILHMINGTYRRPYASLEPSILPYAGGPLGNVSFSVRGAAENVSVHFHAGIPVTFNEYGFPGNKGVRWTVRIYDTTYSSYLTTIVAYVPNGTFRYTLAAGTSYSGQAYAGDPPSGWVTVRHGEPDTVDPRFAAAYLVTFDESGLPNDTAWTVYIDGVVHASTNSSLNLTLPNGSYAYRVGASGGFTAPRSVGFVEVKGQAVVRPVAFVPIRYLVTIRESGLRPGTPWSITVDGVTYGSRSTTIPLWLGDGQYPYTVSPVRGYSVAGGGSGTLTVEGRAVMLVIDFRSSR